MAGGLGLSSSPQRGMTGHEKATRVTAQSAEADNASYLANASSPDDLVVKSAGNPETLAAIADVIALPPQKKL